MLEQEGGRRRNSALRTFKPARWPFLTVATLVVTAWSAVAVSYFYVSRPFDPNKAWDDNAPLKRVYHQIFANQTVPLAGYDYIDSTFDGVTFYYDGTGGVMIDNGRFVRRPGQPVFRVASKNKIVTETLKIITVEIQQAGCDAASINLGPNVPIEPMVPPTAN